MNKFSVKFNFKNKVTAETKEELEYKCSVIADYISNNIENCYDFYWCSSNIESIKIKSFPPDFIYDLVDSAKGVPVKLETNDGPVELKLKPFKFRLFKENMSCVCCGIKGTEMFLEKLGQDFMVNLYAKKDGRFVLMTKDHIVARAYGGRDNYSNMQTMCCECNSLKSHHNVTLDDLRLVKKQNGGFEGVLNYDRPRFQKSVINNNCFIAPLDLNIWEDQDGKLYALDFSKNALSEKDVKIGSIAKNTPLNKVVEINNLSVFSLPNSEECFFFKLF